MSGSNMISMERDRQINGEGHLVLDDDRYDQGELEQAGQAYLAAATSPETYLETPPRCWPWCKGWWKPVINNPIRNLVKSGSLFMAEAERLRRAKDIAGGSSMDAIVSSVASQIDRIHARNSA